MIMGAVVERFAEQSSDHLDGALGPAAGAGAAVDRWAVRAGAGREWQCQYTRKLLFSTTVELTSVVAVGMRPSRHAAVKASKNLPVSVQAVYDKVKHAEDSAGVSPRQRIWRRWWRRCSKDRRRTVHGYGYALWSATICRPARHASSRCAPSLARHYRANRWSSTTLTC
jgi:hypothetical protein